MRIAAASDAPHGASVSHTAVASRVDRARIRSRRLGAGALTVVITLTSCGSGGAMSTAAEAGTTAPAATAPAATAPAATAPAATASTRTAPTDDTAAGSSSAPPSGRSAGCRYAPATCLGVLEPGSYESTHIDVYGTGEPAQLRYLVGEGWANTLDHGPAYWIRPAADYLADPGFDGNDTTSGIYVWADVAAATQDGTCAEKSDNSVGTDATSLAEWLRRLPGIVVTDEPDGTVDGMQAIVLDIQYAPLPGSTCFGERVVPLFASRPGAPDAYVLGINADERFELMLVDVAPGHTAAVYVAGPATRFGDLKDAATTVIASFDLGPGA